VRATEGRDIPLVFSAFSQKVRRYHRSARSSHAKGDLSDARAVRISCRVGYRARCRIGVVVCCLRGEDVPATEPSDAPRSTPFRKRVKCSTHASGNTAFATKGQVAVRLFVDPVTSLVSEYVFS
jgi:hypothetical protein